MNDRDEILQQRDALQKKLTIATTQLEETSKKLEAQTNNANTLMEELKKVAVSSSELLGHLNQRQREGDALRERLGKVLTALAAASDYIMALEARVEDPTELRARYNEALLATKE